MVTGYLIAALGLIAFRWALLRTSRPLRQYLDPGPWGDALAYFIQVQYYRKHSGTEFDTRCLFRGKSLHTPSFYHRYVRTLFSDEAIWNRPWLPNMVLFAIGIVAFLVLASRVLPSGDAAALGLMCLIFLTQTENSRFDDQSVHYLTIQPRVLGALALSLHALLFAVLPSNAIAIVGGSLALFVALNTSVFSRQVAYFCVPLASLISWNIIPLLNLVLATLLSLVLNRGEFLESFSAHWRYAKWYFNTFYQPRQGSGLGYLIRRSLAPPVRYLPRYLDSFVAAALLILVLNDGEDAFARRALGMIGGALIVCAITGTRKFASLGECGRYLAFSLWFLTPLAIVYSLPILGIPQWIAAAIAAIVVIRNILLTQRGRGDLSNPIREIRELLKQAFSNDSAPTVWWSAHYRYGSIPIALGCGQSTFEIQGTDLSEDVMAGLFVRYPFLHCTQDFFERHGVSHLLISKAEWPQDVYGPVDQVIRAHRVLAETPEFVILARQSA